MEGSMEFTDFTQLSSLESLIQWFAENFNQNVEHVSFSFLKKEYILKMNHPTPSAKLNMFESIGYDESSLESRVARIFKLNSFYTIHPIDSTVAMSEELLRILLSALLLAGNFNGSIFGSLEPDMILGMDIVNKEISRTYTFRPSEYIEADPECRLMRLIDVSIPAVKVTTHLRKMMLEQNKKVYWFPWTTRENPIRGFKLQLLWPSTVKVDVEVNLDLLETAPIWFLSYSASDKADHDDALTNLQQFLRDTRTEVQEKNLHIRYIPPATSEVDIIWSTNALLHLFNHQDNFLKELARISGLCMTYSDSFDSKDLSDRSLGLLSLFWTKFVEYLRNCFQELQPIFTFSPEANFNMHANLIHQKLILLDYAIKKELQFQAIHSRASPSREKNIQGRNFFQSMTDSNSAAQFQITQNESNELGHGRKCQLSDEMLLHHPEVPLWIPISQDPGFKTTDMAALYESTLMDESVTEEVKMRLRSEQLVSDIQAFKAANNLACFEDFIRWYSPKDWIFMERNLSKRMADENNLWRNLWNSSKPVLACDQEQIFDPFLEGERCLHFIEDISANDICALIDEHLAEIFCEQLENIRTQMKVPELSPRNPDEIAALLSLHYFTSLEFPRLSTILRSSIILDNETQSIVGEVEDRDVILQRLIETNWDLEKDEWFLSNLPTTYVLKIPGKPDFEGKSILIE